MTPTILVVAKAPVPGQAKTRLTPPATPVQAATIAAASLHATLAAAHATPGTRVAVALTGDLDRSVDPAGLRRILGGCTVFAQRGETFGERLANAHREVGGPVLQVGMDTPQVSPALFAECLRQLAEPGVDAVLGPAADGGWWALGLRRAADAVVLGGVPMSRSDTGARTLAALRERGLVVRPVPELSDVDTMVDAVAVACGMPGSRFARAVAAATSRPVGQTTLRAEVSR
ncbi:TIGR04282 family arsenosugar biosynthesis glycosyltransferase [Crossiella sp. NPDC003009]